MPAQRSIVVSNTLPPPPLRLSVMANNWDFNCPQYVDFQEVHSSDDADSWFDANYDTTELDYRTPSPKKRMFSNLSKAAGRKLSEAKKKTDRSNIENEVNALNMNNLKGHETSGNPFEIINSNDKNSKGNPKRRSQDMIKTIRRSSRLAEKQEIQQEPKRLRSIGGKASLNSSQQSISSVTASSTKLKIKASIPTTPTFMRKKVAKTAKTTEDIEVEKMRNWQEEILKKHRRLAKARRQSKEPLKGPLKAFNHTVPETFHFETDERVKDSQKQSVLEIKKKDFVSSLRSNTPRPKSLERTVPKEFNLSRGKRKNLDSTPYKSMAERIMEFQKRTPARYHTRSRSVDLVISDAKKQSVVQPRTPNLRSLSRTRPNQAVGYEKQEELQLEEMQKYKFKANPVNPKIFEAPILKKSEPKKTIPQPFSLSLRYAKNLNSSVATSCDSFLSQASSKQTTPQLKRKALPVHSGVSFQPKLNKRATTPQPFSFDEKDRERRLKKEEKIKEIFEEEKRMREFHANPFPDLNACGMPAKESKPPTKIQPFNLSDKDLDRAEKQKREMEELLKKLKQEATFKAKPCEVIYKEPFYPKKDSRILTNFSPFELRTEKRAEEWSEFEFNRKEKEEQRQAAERELLERRKQQEEEEVRKLRSEAVHKANPVRRFKTIDIKPSSVPLTEPKSPRFKPFKKETDKQF